MISETLLIIVFLALWIVTFVLMWTMKNRFVAGIGGVIGLILGFRIMLGVDSLLGLITIGIAFYQLYVAGFTEDSGR